MPAKKQVGKVYLTKNGQPYKIMPNGRAKFIKKSSSAGKSKKGGKLGGSVRVAGSVSVAGGLKKRKY